MRVRLEIVLPADPWAVWAILSDWERQAEWMRDADRVEVVSRHREGVHVRLAVATRILGVRAFTEPIEVTVWDPPRRLEIRHGGPVRGIGAWELAAGAGGTRWAWSEDVHVAIPVLGGPLARCYAPILRVLMRRAMEDLRRHVVAIGPDRGPGR